MVLDGDVSRRALLKSAAVGSVGLGLAGAAAYSSDRYIVGATSPDAAMAASSAANVLSRRIDLGPYGTLTVGQYSSAMRASLMEREDVDFVQSDLRLQAPPPGVRDPAGRGTGDGAGAGTGESAGQTLPWGIDRVDADVAHDEGDAGEGAHVAIIDTGIDDAHSDLQDPLADPHGDGNHRAWTECRGEDCGFPWSDDGDHGTHVAGTVAAGDGDDGVVGVAPGATLHALKVCGGGGGCRTSDIAEAIKYAADEGWHAANLSLGSPQESPALEVAGKYATAKGLLLVAAAGNRGCDDCVGYPAAYDEFVAVSATTMEDEPAEFTSTGPEVDLAAPGDEVCSSVVGGHDTFSGTSMASPHVAGSAAQLMADGYASAEAREQLRTTAEDVGLEDNVQGAGLVDTAAALGHDSDDDGTGDGRDCPN